MRTLNGKTVTLSFWARADTNRTITFDAQQRFGSGGSPTVAGFGQTTFNLTSAFQKFTHTFTIPSISGKTVGAGSNLYLLFFVPHNTALTFDLTGVQLERGAVATPFEDRSYGPELALCKRYYQQLFLAQRFYSAGAGAVTSCPVAFPVEMRAAPTLAQVTVYSTVNISGVAYNTTGTAIDRLGFGWQLQAAAAADAYRFQSISATAEL